MGRKRTERLHVGDKVIMYLPNKTEIEGILKDIYYSKEFPDIDCCNFGFIGSLSGSNEKGWLMPLSLVEKIK